MYIYGYKDINGHDRPVMDFKKAVILALPEVT